MVNLKQLKCPACGSSEIIQQSEKLVKCSHCGSSLILQGKLLTSVNENSSKPNSKSKQPIIIIAIILILIFGVVFVDYHNQEQPASTVITQENIKSALTKVNPVEVETRKKLNEASFTPKVEIISQFKATTVAGAVYWIVRVKNISPKPVYRARVVISVFDDKDKRIEEQTGWSIKEVLEPNETSVILALIAKPPENMAKISLAATASKRSFLINNQVILDVSDFVVNKNNNRYEIVGDVKNTTTLNVKHTKIIAEALDSDGKPVGLAHQFSTQKSLGVNESSGFKISSTTFIAQTPASWRLWAIARKDNSQSD